ncbi:MAG: hypothetical protein HZA54_06670 [Planctomycetes bacterium]|nr:hypothetical protein [Planctomycetota bacterium]
MSDSLWTGGSYPEEDVAEGKTFGMLGYLTGGLIGIVALIQKDNAFAVYHGKQSLGLWVLMGGVMFPLGIVYGLVASILPFLGILLFLPILVVLLAGIALAIVGALAAKKGVYQPLPFIGTKIEEVFRGIQKEG